MATTTSKVKMLLGYYGRKQIDLIECLGMGSKQSLNNKFSQDRWSAQDLAIVADFLGCKVGFILPDGTTIYLDPPEKKEEEEP
ncbi:MAG: hypothetical protein IKO07_05965 [Clostridia bacterium]|nr:hypothetical protein [Clostridia bacterium]